jgi:signal transduction histidine kinase
VFEKFVRVEAPPVPSTGTGLGLGLAIARGIVESQDGQIWIEDGRGKYVTKIIFSLPIGKQQS